MVNGSAGRLVAVVSSFFLTDTRETKALWRTSKSYIWCIKGVGKALNGKGQIE